ncbi:glycosyltransferase family 2 protein [Sphingobium fuliginis]|uniref:Glycosyltransferase family 2 protein n=1 Tax=Sphingobium fuliginis ATCC 27551 TaxID=1208342 RepID=A0A5B8CIY9_SPHSA|nr:glycosyltransferase family 2 protein [Sphingobium fuliginis]QDC38060.1 glycosyltransferase family 2 protein [Sphingobium fuliginis ATCC 27551]
MKLLRSSAFDELDAAPDVSIVMPCLNEVQSLPHCIENARAALDEIQLHYGLSGEVVIADNGSTDGSQQLGLSCGARVVPISRKGYGAAIIGGFEAARGRFLVMGDADGSYDFTDSVKMIGKLLDGADLCMGSRFKGGIAPGAMPWKNRYIGNPMLTGILNLFFRCGVSDAHCGLRAIRREACADLHLQGAGMEFASEMVIKASMKRLRIDEVPATLSPDLRNRPPHLRPWRDGWRHLRFLLMFSPTWVFGVPALAAMALAMAILFNIALHRTGVLTGAAAFGASWTIVAGFLLTVGHLAALMALAAHLYGVKRGYRSLRPALYKVTPLLTLEHALLTGSALLIASIFAFGYTGWRWAANGFDAPPSVLPVTVAAVAAALGLQTIFGGFLMAIISGHDSRFVSERGGATEAAISMRNAA